MIKSKLFTLIALCITLTALGQEKIGNKMYMYGSIDGVIMGKTLVNYAFEDPKGATKTVKTFKGIGVDASNWTSVFMPGVQFTEEEINTTLNERGIETIINIKHKGTSQSQTSVSSFGGNSMFTNSVSVVGNVDLDFEVYSISNGFSKPMAVINCNANNSGGVAGSQRSVTRKIVNRVVNKIAKLK